jgi:hypothetical protein
MRYVATIYRTLAALCAAMVMLAAQSAAAKDGAVAPAPEGYHKYIVFVGDGVYPSPDGTILRDGLAGDGMHFQREIMGRTDEQIAQNRQQAIDFIQQRFGIDPINNPDLVFSGYEVDPRNNLRAQVISGERVGSEGWVVHDGGWQAMVTNPNGIMLGGAFPGVVVPQYTVFVFGDYKIMPPRGSLEERGQSSRNPILISYRADKPMSFPAIGALFRCDLFSEEFGAGFNGGVNGSSWDSQGMLHSNLRTVLTFPPLGTGAAQ